MSSPNTIYHLEILIDQGQRLFELRKNIKRKDNTPETPSDPSEEVKDIINKVLNGLKAAPPVAGLTKESIANLVKKIESILEEFVEHDTDYKSVYEKLREEVRKFNSQKQGSDLFAETSAVESSVETVIHMNEPDYGSLSADEKLLLSCFLLFPAGVEIKKREIIHCWLGVNTGPQSIEDFWIRQLDKFVAMELIKRTSKNKKLLNRFKMTKGVHDDLSKLKQNLTYLNELDELERIRMKDEGSYNILIRQNGDADDKPNTLQRAASKVTGRDVVGKVDTFALLNVSQQTTLTTAWLKKVCQMDTLKILHLGSWRQEPEKYILIEDIETFKHIKNLRYLFFLSLEGVTGMVKLPESVYQLTSLWVLDLRGCNNLESIGRGIKSLRYLHRLDLSGCYLLDHVPLEICTLKYLGVLKGFVVTEDDISEQEKAKQKINKQVNNGKEKRKS